MSDDAITENHPRTSDELLGHEAIVTALIPNTNSHRNPHAFIFSGAKGIGKATAAYHFAKKIFANEANLVTAGSHPDMMVLEPEEGKAIIAIEQVREIHQFLNLSPAYGGYRLVIVDSLDNLNLNGANAMLKLLEEPPKNALIILINHQTRPILPTIRSRCQVVKLKPLAIEETQKIIQRMFPDADQTWIETATILADGAPGIAQIFAESGAPDLYTEICTLMAEENKTSSLAIHNLAETLGGVGAKNLAKRQAGRLIFARLIAKATDLNIGKKPQNQAITSEAQALNAIASRHTPNSLARLYQYLATSTHEAETLNLDQSNSFFKLISALAKT